jgi:hypothetical protein
MGEEQLNVVAVLVPIAGESKEKEVEDGFGGGVGGGGFLDVGDSGLVAGAGAGGPAAAGGTREAAQAGGEEDGFAVAGEGAEGGEDALADPERFPGLFAEVEMGEGGGGFVAAEKGKEGGGGLAEGGGVGAAGSGVFEGEVNGGLDLAGEVGVGADGGAEQGVQDAELGGVGGGHEEKVGGRREKLRAGSREEGKKEFNPQISQIRADRKGWCP